MRPYFAMVSATPFSTAASSTTFIATAKASEPFPLILRAVASAASRLRSAITGMPPSAANRSAISLPMPLAAPVTMATLPLKRAIASFPFRLLREMGWLFQVIKHHGTEPKCQVGDEVAGGNDFSNRQHR